MARPRRVVDRGGATVVAETIRAAVELSKLPGVERPITASLGIAVTPDDAGDPTTLIRNADQVLFTAKGRGRNGVEGGIVNPDYRESGRRRTDQLESSRGDEQAEQT
jgi:predicted signal transduction protein with EAL and GGDEF domain